MHFKNITTYTHPYPHIANQAARILRWTSSTASTEPSGVLSRSELQRAVADMVG